jgi:ATP-dependent DNA helicase RecQ
MCDNCLRYKDNLQDYTEQAQKYLSCIVRTDERFGAHYIADILRGSKQKKILENGHNELSTYGIGKEWTKNQWIQLSRLLIRRDHLKKDPDHGSLKLTDQARSVLNGDERVEGVLDRTQTATDEDARPKTSSEVENKYNVHLFEELRKKRKELADEQEIPPYAIFPDTTLMEMSYYFPVDDQSLIGIYGVGSVKQKKYGDAFLRIIREFTETNDVQERSKAIRKKVKKTTEKKKHELVGEEYSAGKSIEHLAEQFGVKNVTILSNLKKYLDEGNRLDPEGILGASALSQRKIDEVYASMDKVGADILKPVYEDLNKTVDYNELRILQLAYLSEHAE